MISTGALTLLLITNLIILLIEIYWLNQTLKEYNQMKSSNDEYNKKQMSITKKIFDLIKSK